jgi:hypothetical protein
LNSPEDVLTKDLEVKGDKTTDNTKAGKDFGPLENSIITKDDSKNSNNDTRIS